MRCSLCKIEHVFPNFLLKFATTNKKKSFFIPQKNLNVFNISVSINPLHPNISIHILHTLQSFLG